jgi:mono/diheme cytochrome c family protein
MRSVRPWIACGAAGFMLLSVGGATVNAQTIRQGPAPRIQSIEGVDSYKAYCAVCHGPAAKGDGPAATALKKVPADLTAIAKRNGSKFSASDVEAVIMGQQTLASHGSREMPIWGPVFESLSPDNSVMKMRVTNLVNYLKSIQTQ